MRRSRWIIPLMLCIALAVFGWINVREKRGPSITLVFNTDPTARIPDDQTRDWRALSGDLMQLDGLVVHLNRVACPAPDTPDGQAAQALLDKLLHSGTISCKISSSSGQSHGECLSETHDFAEVMNASGFCD